MILWGRPKSVPLPATEAELAELIVRAVAVELDRREAAAREAELAAQRPEEPWIMSHSGAPLEPINLFRPGEIGRRHVVTYIGPSFSQRQHAGFLTLLQDSTVKGRWFVHGDWDMGTPVTLDEGCAVRVYLNITLGKVSEDLVACLTVVGYTEVAEQ